MPKPLRKKDDTEQVSVETLHRMECAACPLNKAKLEHGKMPAGGADDPVLYVLAEAPGAEEDASGYQMVGPSGALLRGHLYELLHGEPVPNGEDTRKVSRWLRQQTGSRDGLVRWNNTIRCLPRGDLRAVRPPTHTEVECCRPSVAADIEAYRPAAIIGVGAEALQWVVGEPMPVLSWRGRRFPVRIGGHTCWYLPVLHPAYVLRQGGTSSEEDFLLRLDLRNLINGLPDMGPAWVPDTTDPTSNIVPIDGSGGAHDLLQIDEFLAWADRQPQITIDIETASDEPNKLKERKLRPYGSGARICSIALGTWDRTAAIALDHPQAGWSEAQLATVKSRLCDWLLSYKGRRCAHNAAYEMEWLGYFWDKRLLRAGVWDDTQAMMYMLFRNHTQDKEHAMTKEALSLDWCTQMLLGVLVKSFKADTVDVKDIAGSPLPDVLAYNGMDTKFTSKAWERGWLRVVEQGMERVYTDQLRRTPTLVHTQMVGLPVDQARVREIDKELTAEIDALHKALHAQPVVQLFEEREGHTYNPASPQQNTKLFRDYMRRREGIRGRGPDQKYSTDVKVLEKIDHPVAKAILQLRSYEKRHGTYNKGLLLPDGKSVYPDGKLHPQFNGMLTTTRRLSSDGPNAQNFPKRKHAYMRSQIVAPPGYVMLAFDHGQIEARVIGMISRDAKLCDALWNDWDIHTHWAERLAYEYPERVGGRANLHDKAVMKTFRTDVKNQWTFPLFFNAKPESVAGFLNMPENVVKPLTDEFWEMFQGVRQMQRDLQAMYDACGYVAGPTGWRREAPMTVNEIVNSPVQCTASEIVVDGMNRLSEYAERTDQPWFQPVLNVHDDLTFIVPDDKLEQCADTIVRHMLDVKFDFINVPLLVEGAVGYNWYELEEFGKFYSHKYLEAA